LAGGFSDFRWWNLLKYPCAFERFITMTHPLAFIGTLGAQEMILIFVVMLLLFGAKKLPELARGIGKSMGEFKKARDEFEHEITHAETQASREKIATSPRSEAKSSS
jgi:sec-independent protein translocase protein TatA